jgi:hypothetical protein
MRASRGEILWGFEQPADSPKKTASPSPGGAQSGALAAGAAVDPGLARVVAAWPGLPAEVRDAVLALVNAAP